MILYGFLDSDSATLKGDGGRLNVLFEEDSHGDLVAINQLEPFCKTGQVFITRGFSQLKEKYYTSNYPKLLRIDASSNPDYDSDDANRCKYSVDGFNIKQITPVDSKKLPIQIITENYLAENRDPCVRFDLLSYSFYVLIHDINKRQIIGPWFVIPPQTETFGESAYCNFGIKPAEITKNSSKNSVYIIDDNNFNQKNEIISARFIQADANNKYGELRFVKNKDIILSKGIKPAIHLTTEMIADELAKIIEKEKLKIQLGAGKITPKLLSNYFRNNPTLLKGQITEQGLNEIVFMFESHDEYAQLIEQLMELFYTKSKNGQITLEQYVEKNFTKLLNSDQKSKLDSRIAEMQKDFEQKESENKQKLESLFKAIEDQKQQRQQLDNELDLRKKELLALNDSEAQKRALADSISSRKQELDDRYRDIQHEIEQKSIVLNNLEQKYSKLKELENIESEIAYLKRSFNEKKTEQEKDLNKLNDQKEALQTEIDQKDKELIARVYQVVPHIHATLRGRPTNNVFQQLEFLLAEKIKINSSNDLQSDNLRTKLAADLSIYLSKKFELQERTEYSPLFIANLLISIENNFLTFILGKPGVGKTSLVKILKDLLKLKSSFLEVPVAKGWDSERDWIGFYNALQNEFVASRTGVYRYLKSISDLLNNDKKSISMPLILLDEANLSVMEHYWSQFNSMADKESEREFVIDGDIASLRIHPMMRFIGTINSDHTTQTLSERTISRACVIVLDEKIPYQLDADYNIDYFSFDDWFKNEHSIDSYQLHEIFSQEIDSSFNDGLKAVNKIIESFLTKLNSQTNEQQLKDIIRNSNRTNKKINSYAKAAIPIFHTLINSSSVTLEAENVVADFAISQFIIPNLRMNGIQAKSRLQKSLAFCEENGFEISKNLLSLIIQEGSEKLDQYGFFNN